jgi:hypothetical protein
VISSYGGALGNPSRFYDLLVDMTVQVAGFELSTLAIFQFRDFSSELNSLVSFYSTTRISCRIGPRILHFER